MMKRALAIFLLMGLAGHALAAEVTRVSVAPLLELEYPPSFVPVSRSDYLEAMQVVREKANPNGYGLKADLEKPVVLMKLNSSVPGMAVVELSVEPPWPALDEMLAGDDAGWDEFAKKLQEHETRNHAKLNAVITEVRARPVNLAGGRQAVECLYQIILPDGQERNRKRILLNAEHFSMIFTADMVTDARERMEPLETDIQSVIHSIRLLDGPAAEPAMVSESPVARPGLIRFTEPQVLEMWYPENFIPEERVMKEIEAKAAKAKVAGTENAERLLLRLHHRDEKTMAVNIRLAPAAKGLTQETVSDLSEENLQAFTRRVEKIVADDYASRSRVITQPIRVQKLDLASGLKALSVIHGYRDEKGAEFDVQEIRIYTEHIIIFCVMEFTAQLEEKWFDELDELVRSIQLYSGTERVFTPGVQKEQVAEIADTEGMKVGAAPPSQDGAQSAVHEPSAAAATQGSSTEEKVLDYVSKHLPSIMLAFWVLTLVVASCHYMIGSAAARARRLPEFIYLYLLGYSLLLWPLAVTAMFVAWGGESSFVLGNFAVQMLLFGSVGFCCLRRKKWAFILGSLMSLSPFFYIGGFVFALTGGRKVWGQDIGVVEARIPQAPFIHLPEPTVNFVAPKPPTAAVWKPEAESDPSAMMPSPAPSSPVRALPEQTDFLVHDGTQQYGPMTLEKVRGQLADGWLSAENQYWHEAEEAWRPLAELMA